MGRTRQTRPELTPRQREVWRLVAKGHTNGEIAEILGISLDGAKWHVGELLVRLDADTREDLVEQWESQRGAAARLRTVFRGLAALSWPKAAGAGVALGSVAVASAVIASAGSGSGTASQESPSRTATTTPSAGISTVLAEQEALFRAETEANRLLLEHLLPYLADPNFRLNRTALISSKFIPAGETYATQDGTQRLTPTAVNVWAFSWLAEGHGLVDGPLGGPGDARIEVVLADSTTLDVVAEQAQVRVINGGIWTYGHVRGFEPERLGDDDGFKPAGEAYEVTPPGGGRWGERLVLFVSKSGYHCHRAIRPDGSAMGACGTFEGATADEAISVLGFGGSSGLFSGSEPPPPWLMVRTAAEATTFAVQSADGSEERFPAMEIPPALGLPYRIAYFTSPKLEAEHWFVAYDADGHEVHRQGPWTPTGGEIAPYFLP